MWHKLHIKKAGNCFSLLWRLYYPHKKKSTHGYCFRERNKGWQNKWFAVLFDGEENSSDYRGMMVIAHINEENLELVKSLPASVRFTVELAECLA